MTDVQPLHLQYGVNVFADEVYKDYQPPKVTAHYPDPVASELRRAIAEYVGCDENMVLCSSGSDELIDLYIRIHKMRIPQLQMAFAPPTYPQYEVYGNRAGVELIKLSSDMSVISAKLVAKQGGDPRNTVIMLDSPSNPSGQEVTREQFVDLLEAGYEVFADEAYYEFKGNTVVDLVKQYPRQLVVSRSFSKFAAMSGSRVGYMVAAPDIVKDFRAHQLFFNVNIEGQHRALYALQHIQQLHDAITQMGKVNGKVLDSIRALGSYQVLPSLDMFTIFSHKSMPTAELHEKLQVEHAIETAHFADFGGHDIIRSAVLQWPAMERLVAALRVYA